MNFNRNTAVVSIMLLLMVGCNKEFELKYYESGEVRSKAEIRNGRREGGIETFYKNGSLKSKGSLHKGKADGKIEWYYENGDLEEINFCENGELNGPVSKYYRGGRLRIQSEYINGRHSGRDIHFMEDGSLSELSLYDSLGNLYYLTKWSKDGKRLMQAFMPVFMAAKRGDSLILSATSKIRIDGLAYLSIGIWDSKKAIDPVLVEIRLSGATRVAKTISKDVNLNDLFYKIRFEPSELDTIRGFEFTKRVFNTDSILGKKRSIDETELAMSDF